jgi:hypothetical protein
MDILFFVAKVLLNIFVVYIISYYIFLKYNSSKKFFFTYNLMGLITFLLCYLLSSVSLEIGFSLGLFAILAIIRFRTVNIPIKQMTYLFVIIGISVINSLVSNNNMILLIIANIIVILFLLLIENKLSSLRNEED